QTNPAESGSVERTNAFVLYLILAFDLLHNKLGIRENLELFAAREHSETKGGKKRGIFREVVSAGAKILGYPHDAWKVHADSRFARISARASVDIGLKLHATSNG